MVTNLIAFCLISTSNSRASRIWTGSTTLWFSLMLRLYWKFQFLCKLILSWPKVCCLKTTLSSVFKAIFLSIVGVYHFFRGARYLLIFFRCLIYRVGAFEIKLLHLVGYWLDDSRYLLVGGVVGQITSRSLGDCVHVRLLYRDASTRVVAWRRIWPPLAVGSARHIKSLICGRVTSTASILHFQ